MIYTDGVYLVADSYDELHAFANAIGIPRTQCRHGAQYPNYPHYRLDSSKVVLKMALTRGAQLTTTQKVLETMEDTARIEGGRR